MPEFWSESSGSEGLWKGSVVQNEWFVGHSSRCLLNLGEEPSLSGMVPQQMIPACGDRGDKSQEAFYMLGCGLRQNNPVFLPLWVARQGAQAILVLDHV